MYGMSYSPNSAGKNSTTEIFPSVNIPLVLTLTGTDSLIDYTRTDSLGEFALEGLIPGSSYDLLVDVPGLPMDSATAINFTFPTGEDSLEVEVVIDSAAIFLDFSPATNLQEVSAATFLKSGLSPHRINSG